MTATPQTMDAIDSIICIMSDSPLFLCVCRAQLVGSYFFRSFLIHLLLLILQGIHGTMILGSYTLMYCPWFYYNSHLRICQ